MHRIVVLGLDGFNPELVRLWLDEMPNLKEMQRKGIWGNVESTVPATTASAWTCAQCGRNPGAYGFWDFNFRDDFSYGEPKLVDSRISDERVNSLYKMLPKMGQRVAIINVPFSWPPPKIPAGYCITGFMTPSLEHGFTWPESLKDEVHSLLGDYILDTSQVCASRRLAGKGKALKRIRDIDAQRFTLLRHFIREKNCDYSFAVLMGVNLVSHLFCRYFDKESRQYNSEFSYKNVLHDYYKWVDKNIGEVQEALDDETVLFVHSAYSVQRLDGRINLNEWLINEGYMVLYEFPSKPTALRKLRVDWSRTKAWATGYTGQIYINLKGREPQGIVKLDDYGKLLDEIAKGLQDVPDRHGKALNTRVFKREDIHFGPYAEYGPDMFINFDECRWGTSELVGHGRGKTYSFDTPDGPDDGPHGFLGYFCIAGAGIPAKGKLKGISLLNCAPTVLEVLKLQIPMDMEKPSILHIAKEEKTLPASEAEERVHSRLEALGY